MLLDNREDRREMDIEELIDIVLNRVNTAGDFRSNDKTHYDLSVHCSLNRLQLYTHRAKTLASNFRA